MYKFNKTLLAKLPELFGIKRKEFKEKLGVPSTTHYRWVNGGGISMGSLTDVINRLHLSFADFIITEKYPIAIQEKEYYMVPDEVWQPVEWMPGKIASLYGENSITGIPNIYALSKKLGHSTYRKLERWIREETEVRVEDFVHIINTLQIDAKFFINDNNKPILRPVFGLEKVWESQRIRDLENENSKLRLDIRTRDVQLLKLKNEMSYMKREYEAKLSSSSYKTSTGIVADNSPMFFLRGRGYVFHKELWKSLPEIFGFSGKELCIELGIRANAFSLGNVKVDTAIKVCNHLRMSFSHLIRPLNEPSVIRDKGSYAISRMLFKPIESKMRNLRYIFRKETFGLTLKNLEASGIHWMGKESLMEEDGKRSMMVTLADICTTFNIPPSAFVYDPNDRNRPAYSVSLNETLIENCINMSKELEKCRKEIRRLKGKDGATEKQE